MGAAALSSPPPTLEAAAAAASNPPTPTAENSARPAKEDPQAQSAAAAGAADGAAAGASADAAETVILDASGAAGEGEDEQAECALCLYFKGGGCKEEFIAWQKCLEEAEAATDGVDVAERCQDITDAFLKCMAAHPDYYEPILSAGRAMTADLEAFKAQEAAAAASDSAAQLSEEGENKPAPDAGAPPSEEGQEKQAISEKESGDPAA